jgi:hypothetical protein
MKKFKIQYLGRYIEHKEYYSEIIDARTEKSALKKFMKTFNIKKSNIYSEKPDLAWWDNEWLMELRSITEIQTY